MTQSLQKIVILLSLSLAFLQPKAQFYKFEKTSAPYQEISGGTLITNTFTAESYLVNLPVNLTLFDKQVGSSLNVGVNGFIVATSPSYSFATDPLIVGLNPIDNTSSLKALGVPDGNGDTIIVIQWKNLAPDSANAGDYVNFQCRIYAHTQTVEFAYGPNNVTTPKYLNGNAQISAGVFLLSTDFNTSYDLNMLFGEPLAVKDTSDANADVYLQGFPGNGTVYRFSRKSTTSVSEVARKNINLYPNPAQDILTIETDEEIKSAQIITSLGQNIKTPPLQGKTLNISTLQPGVYFLNVEGQNFSQRLKFIKQ